MLFFLNVLGIQHGDQFRASSGQGLHVIIQLHPVKTAMCGIWIDADNRPLEPAFALPKLGIEKNLDTIADLDVLSHATLSPADNPEQQDDPDCEQGAADHGPPRIPAHEASEQNVKALEEENAACQNKHSTKDV